MREASLPDPDPALSAAASTLIRDLPRDQALGLRLIALARAAAAAHMTQRSAQIASPTREDCASAPLHLSQAAALARGVQASRSEGGAAA